MSAVQDPAAEVFAEQRRQARIDMAAAHRLAVLHD